MIHKEHAGSPWAKHHYRVIITVLLEGEKADTVSASMFKGEIRNPDYTPDHGRVRQSPNHY